LPTTILQNVDKIDGDILGKLTAGGEKGCKALLSKTGLSQSLFTCNPLKF
jgi:hypothetical protein